MAKSEKQQESDKIKALAILVGAGLVVFPEPSTTAIGATLILATLGAAASGK